MFSQRWLGTILSFPSSVGSDSVDRLPFEWSNSNPTALQSLRFFEAGIDVLPIYREMEKASLLSDRYPVKGSLIGQAQISARLLAP